LLESDSKTSCDNNTQQQPCLTACISRTTWISEHQKGRTILDFNEARDDRWQWHQLDHMQTICTLLQTDNQYFARNNSVNAIIIFSNYL